MAAEPPLRPELVAECIGKRFGGRSVLSAATLRVEAGSVTALVGRNGVGKSTLLKIAAGWMRPDHGTVRFGGRVHLHPRLHHLAGKGLFFLPDRDLLSPGFSVREHLDSVARRWSRMDAAEVVGLTRLEAHLEQRRLAGTGCGVVVTGHEIPALWDVADHVVWCTDGTTYDLGSPAAAAADWRFRQGFLAPTLW